MVALLGSGGDCAKPATPAPVPSVLLPVGKPVLARFSRYHDFDVLDAWFQGVNASPTSNSIALSFLGGFESAEGLSGSSVEFEGDRVQVVLVVE